MSSPTEAARALGRPTHAELVEIARRWLLGAGRCGFVFVEYDGPGWEKADALGFHTWYGTTLVECKTSRADFFRDAEKPFRQNPELGLGRHRYYLCPTGLIRPTELPKDWGLIYVSESGRARRVVEAQPFVHWAEDIEVRIMASALRRVHRHGHWHAAQWPYPAHGESTCPPEALPLPAPLFDEAQP